MTQFDRAVPDQQMPIRGSDIDLAICDRLAITSVRRREMGGSGQYFRKVTVGDCGNVRDDEERRRKTLRQVPYDGPYRLNPSSGRANDDDSAFCHVSYPFPDPLSHASTMPNLTCAAWRFRGIAQDARRRLPADHDERQLCFAQRSQMPYHNEDERRPAVWFVCLARGQKVFAPLTGSMME